MNKFNYAVYALLYIALLGLLGVLNVVVLKEMDWTLLTSPDFWFYQANLKLFLLRILYHNSHVNYDILEDTDVELAIGRKDKRQT